MSEDRVLLDLKLKEAKFGSHEFVLDYDDADVDRILNALDILVWSMREQRTHGFITRVKRPEVERRAK